MHVSLQTEWKSCQDSTFPKAANKAKEMNLVDYTFTKPVYRYSKDTFELSLLSRKIEFLTVSNEVDPPEDILDLILLIKELSDNIPIGQVKLNKLMINLARYKKWPYAEKSVESVAQVFISYKTLFESNGIESKHQKDFTQFVRDFNKTLREKSLSLTEIAEKIETKMRTAFFGPHLQQRIQELFQIGFHRFENSAGIALFCKTFARYPSVECIGELVDSLSAFDRANGSWFLKGLLIEALSQEDRAPLLTALMENKNFITYMRQRGCIDDNLKETLLKFCLDDEVCDFIVHLGDELLFRLFINHSMVNELMLTSTQIGRIFTQLNKKLLEDNIHKENYRLFLTALRDRHRLHLLQPFCGEEAVIQSNLETLNIRYRLPFSIYFNNAPFRYATEIDISDERFNSFMFKFLPIFGKNGVHQHFKNQMSLVFKDYEQGFEDLFEIVLPKMGEWCVTKQRLGVDNFVYYESNFYKHARDLVLMCLPNRWKKEISSFASPLSLLCLYNNCLFLTDHNDQGQTILRGFSRRNHVVNSLADECLFYDDIETVKSSMKELLKDEKNREAVSAFMEAYMNKPTRTQFENFNNVKNYKTESFIDRINMLTNKFKGK